MTPANLVQGRFHLSRCSHNAGSSSHVIRLDRKEFLQGVSGTVSSIAQTSILTQTLTAELSFSAQGLLRTSEYGPMERA